MAEAGAGVLLGVDVGTVRIGVAVTDASGALAVPLATVRRDEAAPAAVEALAAEHGAVEVVIGLPLTLAGEEGPAAAAVRSWVSELLQVAPDRVIRLVDERMTTAASHRLMGAAGRTSRERRELVDQAAAVAILETVVEARRQGHPVPGTVLGKGALRARKARVRHKERTP